jgi:hypothetical protein
VKKEDTTVDAFYYELDWDGVKTGKTGKKSHVKNVKPAHVTEPARVAGPAAGDRPAWPAWRKA